MNQLSALDIPKGVDMLLKLNQTKPNIYIYKNSNGFSVYQSPQRLSYQWLKKWYLMPPGLTQHYKVRIKGKVEQFRERSNALPYTSV